MLSCRKNYTVGYGLIAWLIPAGMNTFSLTPFMIPPGKPALERTGQLMALLVSLLFKIICEAKCLSLSYLCRKCLICWLYLKPRQGPCSDHRPFFWSVAAWITLTPRNWLSQWSSLLNQPKCTIDTMVQPWYSLVAQSGWSTGTIHWHVSRSNPRLLLKHQMQITLVHYVQVSWYWSI